MRTIPITVVVRSDGIDVNPTYANVPNNATEDVRLRWTAVGATFAADQCVLWKNDPPGAPKVPCTGPSTTVLESETYRNDDPSRRVWQYSITLLVNGTEVTIDPEVNNEPPTP